MYGRGSGGRTASTGEDVIRTEGRRNMSRAVKPKFRKQNGLML